MTDKQPWHSLPSGEMTPLCHVIGLGMLQSACVEEEDSVLTIPTLCMNAEVSVATCASVYNNDKKKMIKVYRYVEKFINRKKCL